MAVIATAARSRHSTASAEAIVSKYSNPSSSCTFRLARRRPRCDALLFRHFHTRPSLDAHDQSRQVPDKMAVAAGRQQPTPSKETKMNDDGEKPVEANSAPVMDATPIWDLSSKIAVKSREKMAWNTGSLGQRLAVDTMCAAAAGGLVAPVVSMIDKAIIENASGRQTLGHSIKSSLSTLLLRPHIYLSSKPFALIFMVYGGTYMTANVLDTAKSTTQGRPASATSSGPAKFVATSAANLSLTMVKDSQFTKMFGTASSRPVPPATFALFALRDSMTIFASFNLPPLLAPALPMSQAAEAYVSRASAAQFVAPAAIQLVSTPLHLFGLDMYNRNGGTPLADRLHKVRVDWLKSSLARMCRIIPAFGFGGVVNNGMRAKFMKQLE